MGISSVGGLGMGRRGWRGGLYWFVVERGRWGRTFLVGGREDGEGGSGGE